VRAEPFVTPMRRGRLPACSRRHECMDGLHRPSGRNASSDGISPIYHHVAGPEPTRVVDRDKAGRPRARDLPHPPAHGPPSHRCSPISPNPAL